MIGSRSTYTRKRILDAAGRLFALKGESGTSLREITAEARVNLSSVNYHFGSKEGLIRAVTQQRLDALNHEQLAMLDHLEAGMKDGMISPGEIVEAFFAPLIRHAIGPVMNARTDAAASMQKPADPGGLIRFLILCEAPEVMERFRAALTKALPDTPERELFWRFHFMLGAATNALSGADGLLLAPDRSCPEPFDLNQLAHRLMSFLVGGLLAPLPDGAAGPAGQGVLRHRLGAEFRHPRGAQRQRPE